VKRLEIVHLRLTGTDSEALVDEIRESIASQKGLLDVVIFRSHPVPTDLSIHLHMEAECNGVASRELGIRLAAELRAHGMVEHTAWVEVQS
jgi:hypothetical protein